MGKFKKQNWVLPLLSHVSIHGAFTFIIAYTITLNALLALLLGLLDLGLHFLMDRIKASSDLLGRFKALSGAEYVSIKQQQACEKLLNQSPDFILRKRLLHNKLFWIASGFDAMWHNLTDLLTIYLMVTYG